MYVRWKRRVTPSRWEWREYNRGQSAVLVASERRNGQPRQRVVAYLGSITDGDLHTEWGCSRFWAWALRRLDALDLAADARGHIEAALARVVPRPSDAALAADAARGEAAMAMLKAMR